MIKAYVSSAVWLMEPPAELRWASSRSMRGASKLTRMLLEVAADAAGQAKVNPQTVETVYASSYGEIETMVALLDSVYRRSELPSPMRFKNSVHNAASGLASIGQNNRAFSTAIAAGDQTFETGFIEAMIRASIEDEPVVFAAADDAVPPPFDQLEKRTPLALGFCLSSKQTEASIASVELLTEKKSRVPLSELSCEDGAPIASVSNPIAAGIPLFRALRQTIRPSEKIRVPLSWLLGQSADAHSNAFVLEVSAIGT